MISFQARYDGLASRPGSGGGGGVEKPRGMLHATETGNKLRPRGTWARVRLYLYLTLQLLEPGYLEENHPTTSSQQFLTKQVNKPEYLLLSKNIVIG